jgi:hypothetical protein
MSTSLVVAVVAVATLAGCGSSGDKTGSLQSIDPLVERLETVGFECDEPRSPDGDEGSMEIGIPPEEEVDCEIGEVPVSFSRWKNSGQAQSTMARALLFACGFGMTDFTYVADANWAGDAESDADVTDGDLAKANATTAEALGADLIDKGCPED